MRTSRPSSTKSAVAPGASTTKPCSPSARAGVVEHAIDASDRLSPTCDTSFASLIAQRQTHPERFAHWDHQAVARIDAGTLAISVITLAEARYGYLKAGWGQPKIERNERRLGAFAAAAR